MVQFIDCANFDDVTVFVKVTNSSSSSLNFWQRVQIFFKCLLSVYGRGNIFTQISRVWSGAAAPILLSLRSSLHLTSSFVMFLCSQVIFCFIISCTLNSQKPIDLTMSLSGKMNTYAGRWLSVFRASIKLFKILVMDGLTIAVAFMYHAEML